MLAALAFSSSGMSALVHHLDLLVDLGFALRAFEGDVDVEVLGRLLRASLDRLPELVLEALRDHGDVGLGFRRFLGGRGGWAGGAAAQHQGGQRDGEQQLGLHVFAPVSLRSVCV
jgi:hypothetical protein